MTSELHVAVERQSVYDEDTVSLALHSQPHVV